MGATKIALGHHRDDIIETLLLNIFYSGQLKAMPPRLVSDDGRNVVIRPLAYCSEEELIVYARQKAFPIIPCDLCGSQENLQRQKIKELVRSLAAQNGTVPGNLLAALKNVRPTHLLNADLQQAWAQYKAQGNERQPKSPHALAGDDGVPPSLVTLGSLSLSNSPLKS